MNIDFFNTVNGGMSEPSLAIKNSEEGHEIKVKTPGLGTDSLQVEIIDNRLVIYHLVPIYSKKPENIKHSVRLIHNLTIPNHVDLEGISAEYNEPEKALTVFFPNNPQHKNIRRTVDIRK